jgi:hypothetical protein
MQRAIDAAFVFVGWVRTRYDQATANAVAYSLLRGMHKGDPHDAINNVVIRVDREARRLSCAGRIDPVRWPIWATEYLDIYRKAVVESNT